VRRWRHWWRRWRDVSGYDEDDGYDYDDEDEEGSSDSEYYAWVAMHPHLGKAVVRLLVMLGTPKSSAYTRDQVGSVRRAMKESCQLDRQQWVILGIRIYVT